MLSANYVLRPARESIGVERGISELRWLYLGTLGAMILVNPIFGALVARVRRRTAIAFTYRFFILNLIGFWVLIRFFPEGVGVTSGRVFYVWLSVFNVFAVSLFWVFMADCFTLADSKRLYGLFAVGGTLGALTGSVLVHQTVEHIGTTSLFLVAAVLLEGGAQCARQVDRWSRAHPDDGPASSADRSKEKVGGSAFEGLAALGRDGFLRGIAIYVFMFTVVGTLFYFQKIRIVEALGEDRDTTTGIFARIDLWTQIATLVTQLFLTGVILRVVGLPAGLAALPASLGAGLVLLIVAPSVAAVTILEAATKAIRYAVSKPARETLFTVVAREDKYKTKPLIDTACYRFGDLAGVWLDFGLVKLATATALAAATAMTAFIVPFAVGWCGLGVWLGVKAQRRGAKAGAERVER